MKSPIVLLVSLLNDIGRLDPHAKGLERDIRTLEFRYEHEGISFLTVTLPAFCMAIERGLSEGQFRCPLGFRKLKGSSLPRLFSGLTSNVFDTATGLVKETVDEGCLSSIFQLTMLFKKVQMDSKRSDKLHKEAVSDFFLNDELIGQNVLSDRDTHYLGLVTRFILPSLTTLEADESEVTEADLHELLVPIDFRLPLTRQFKACNHGPGAVSEKLSPNQKWIRTYQGILTGAFDETFPIYDQFALNHRSPLSGDDDQIDRIRNELQLNSETVASRSTSRLISVAKNSTSRRTITIEPTLNQFIQQGLKAELWDSITQCSILRNCLDVSDQSKNQKLALEGSLYDNWATIDLKSASDLLSLRLVRQVFSNRPDFLRRLEDCRSRYVTCDNVTREIAKYAGMGNATTFPVQSVVFAVLAITAVLDTQGKYPTYWAVRRASRCVRVYGDDIIVDTRYTHAVVAWLVNAGLKVNINKSFLNGYFKESCGVRCYKGVDYTPLYLKHLPDDSSTKSKAIEGLVSFSNNAWMRGLYRTSNCIAGEVEDRLRINLPLTSSRTAALGWHTRIGAQDFHHWNTRLQRFETKSLIYRPRKRADKLDGLPALLKFFHTPLLGRNVDHLQESSVRFQLRAVRKRVPVRTG